MTIKNEFKLKGFTKIDAGDEGAVFVRYDEPPKEERKREAELRETPMYYGGRVSIAALRHWRLSRDRASRDTRRSAITTEGLKPFAPIHWAACKNALTDFSQIKRAKRRKRRGALKVPENGEKIATSEDDQIFRSYKKSPKTGTGQNGKAAKRAKKCPSG